MTLVLSLKIVLEPGRNLSDDEVTRLEVEHYELAFAVVSVDARDPAVALPVEIIAVRCVGVQKI